MPAKSDSPAEDLEQREAQLASRASYLAAEENKITKQKEEIKEMLDKFEARMNANKDQTLPYCPVRDKKLVPVRYTRMEPHPETGKMRETTDPEWVSADHPCLLVKTIPRTGQHFDPYAVIADWRPLRPGERIPEDAVVKKAGDTRTRAAHMEELSDKAPTAATIPLVRIENGVVKEAISG